MKRGTIIEGVPGKKTLCFLVKRGEIYCEIKSHLGPFSIHHFNCCFRELVFTLQRQNSTLFVRKKFHGFKIVRDSTKYFEELLLFNLLITYCTFFCSFLVLCFLCLHAVLNDQLLLEISTCVC